MLVSGQYAAVTPASDGGIPVPDGVYLAKCIKVEDKPNSKGNPQSILTFSLDNQADWPAGAFKPGATRSIWLQIPPPDAKDDDYTKEGFLKAVMCFYSVEKAQAVQMLQQGIDTASFANRTAYLRLATGPKKEKDANGVEKEVQRQDCRLISLHGYQEAKGATGGAAAGQQSSAGANAAFGGGQPQIQQPAKVAITLDPAVFTALMALPNGMALVQEAVPSLGTGQPSVSVSMALMPTPALWATYNKQVTNS